MSARRWRIELPDGSSRLVDARGLTIGRGLEADVIAADPQASRRHAVIHLAADGPVVVPLGRAPTWVDGEAINAARSLGDGVRVAVPGLEVQLRAEREPDEAPTPTWVIERASGALLGVSPPGLTLGGGPEDDVLVEGWAPAALRLIVAQGGLSVANAIAIELDGERLEPGSLEPLERGGELQVHGETLRVVAGNERADQRTTEFAASSHPGLPQYVRLSFRPRGGHLELEVGRQRYALDLPERRCELIALLLRPPAPERAGELIADDSIGPRLWPKRATWRTDLNILVYRLRRDLTAAGLDGARLIERPRAGHATRMCLAPGATVIIE